MPAEFVLPPTPATSASPPTAATSASGSGAATPKRALKLPNNVKAAPLGVVRVFAPQPSETTSATSATIRTTAAVTSTPTASLIAAKTGRQVGASLRVFGPGLRGALRVTRL
jgi:hypothetical protein